MSEAPPEFSVRYASALARLYQRAGAARWNLDEDSMAAAAHRGALASGAVEGDRVESYVDSLRAEDLALAVACKSGNSAAWEYFITSTRVSLYSAARAIAGDEMRGRELADSLWADLYGLEVRDGSRKSLLDYFHGRSSILTWLRAVMAQRYVDHLRATARTDSLDENLATARANTDPGDDPFEPGRARYVRILGAALDEALINLDARDRMRLGYYYRHDLSLKQIGRLMNEHESTVSRNLARTRDNLKTHIERTLREREKLSREQISLCYDYAAGDLKIDLARALPEPRALPEVKLK